MTSSGVKDADTRVDLIALLKAIGTEKMSTDSATGGGMMDGVMHWPEPSLKNLGPGQQVTGIRHCGDTYDVTIAIGVLQQL